MARAEPKITTMPVAFADTAISVIHAITMALVVLRIIMTQAGTANTAIFAIRPVAHLFG
jgi:hypothetical protein